MSDKEILYQMIGREVDNIVGKYIPALRGFSNVVSNYVIKIVDPYVDAFMEGGQINTEAAEHYLKDETNKKIDEYMNKFKQDRLDDGL